MFSLYFIVDSTWNKKQCPWNQTIFLPNCLSSCMLHLMTINCSTFSGFKEVLLGVTSQLWLHWGLQTSVDLPGQAWASRVGDIRPPSCNRSQSPIWCHLQLGLHWACDRPKHIQHGAACGYYLLFSGEQWAFGICPTLTHCHPWSSWKYQKLPTAVCDSCMCIVYNAAVQGFDHWYW